MSDTDGDTDGNGTVTAPSPDAVAEREDVAVREKTRTFEDEKFEGLRARYDRIDGVVMVGLVADGAVLLQGDGEWYPPGGEVDPGEDWAEAARRSLEALTGVDVSIDAPVLVEFSEFRRAGDENDAFDAPAVHFRASLAGDDPAFREDPTVPEDFDHPAFDREEIELAWFETVPDDVTENHEDHVRLFVE